LRYPLFVSFTGFYAKRGAMKSRKDMLPDKASGRAGKSGFRPDPCCSFSIRCLSPWMMVCLFFTIFTGHPAAGYVLPGRLVLQLMVGNLNPPAAMVIAQNVTIYDKDGVSTVFRERGSYLSPGRFRSESDDQSEKRIHVESLRSGVTLINGRIIASSEIPSGAWMDRYKDLFCFRSRDGLADRLEASGVNVDVSSLGRFQDMLVYVIGDTYPREAAPQLWVDKETFKPARWIAVPKESSSDGLVREIRYLSWRRVNNAWYPGRVEFYAGDQMIKTIDVLTMDLNPDIPSGQFDVESIIINHSGDAVRQSLPGQ